MSKADNQVKLLYMLTEQLVYLLQNEPTAKEEWDHHISQIHQLLAKRQTLIEQLPNSYTSEEIQLGKKIIAMNEIIERLLKEFQNKIKQELQQIQKSKLMQQKYADGTGFSFDGMFIDKQG